MKTKDMKNLESEVARLCAVVEELLKRVEVLEEAVCGLGEIAPRTKPEAVEGPRGLRPEKPTKCELPERAWELLEKARDAGLLDAEWKPRISQRKSALLANTISMEVFGERRWKPFEELWGIKNLQQCYQHVQYLNTIVDDEKAYEAILGIKKCVTSD